MNNKNNENCIHFNTNPMGSIILMTALMDIAAEGHPNPATLMNAIDVIVKSICEGLNINSNDIPLYVMALDVIKTSLMTQMSDEDVKLYEWFKDHSDVTTIVTQHRTDNDKEDNDNE